MKKLFLFLSVAFFIFPKTIFAHGSGYPPFFKIEGKLAGVYALQNAGIFTASLPIPQDTAPRNYMPNEQIPFEIDTAQLAYVFPPEIMNDVKYRWDFGDGTKDTGVKKEHAYKKPGSYILTITADFGSDPNNPPQLIESALINVLPSKNYRLPKAIIKVNGKKGSKGNYNILDFDLSNPVTFDGSDSYVYSSKIVKYAWDFGDDKDGNGRVLTHQYELPQAFATVVLRVTDANGIFSDAYINLRNSGRNEPNHSKVAGAGMIAGPALLAVIAALIGVFLKGRKKE